MIECIFTIDYEIYGDGHGSLKELVYEPAKQLKALFDQLGAKLVVFVEAAELEKIDTFGTDPAIEDVKQQIRDFHEDGHEIALHVHPQWCNARYQDGAWKLDYKELMPISCLSEQRIDSIVGHSIAYLRSVVDDPDFTPLSFRAGNWLFQPTGTIARVLTRYGIKIDSSVYKGGRQRKHKLDYRPAMANGYYWKFRDDVNVSDPTGPLLEVPIYTRMVPFWEMATSKRIGLQYKAANGTQPARDRFDRLLDLARFRHPLKFDFCRMTLAELLSTIEAASHADQSDPELYKPILAIGHTKDLTDFDAIKALLIYLHRRSIKDSTLYGMYQRHNILQPSH